MSLTIHTLSDNGFSLMRDLPIQVSAFRAQFPFCSLCSSFGVGRTLCLAAASACVIVCPVTGLLFCTSPCFGRRFERLPLGDSSFGGIRLSAAFPAASSRSNRLRYQIGDALAYPVWRRMPLPFRITLDCCPETEISPWVAAYVGPGLWKSTGLTLCHGYRLCGNHMRCWFCADSNLFRLSVPAYQPSMIPVDSSHSPRTAGAVVSLRRTLVSPLSCCFVSLFFKTSA